MTSSCPACGAPIIWVHDDRTAGRVALDAHEVAAGPSRFVIRDGRAAAVSATWSGLAYTRHADTCGRPR